MHLTLFAVCTTLNLAWGLPSMRDSLTNPVHVHEGDDALITCVVRDIGNNTVMWKKEDKERHSRRILTVRETTVTPDTRITVLHDSAPEKQGVPSGGDVWVLVIKNAKPSDSGIYVCEVNSNPLVRSFHKLSVLSKALTPPDNSSDPLAYENQKPVFSSQNHNYTDCCIEQNVSTNCLGFCNIQSILEGSTGQDPENCEGSFPAIVKCMADGRNHVPCCIHERVPDICQDVCRGEYTAITNNIKTHFSCSAYTEQTLACIVEGIELLPSPPEFVDVDSPSESSLRISWSPPASNAETITAYSINVTSLQSFDSRLLDPEETLAGKQTNSSSHMIHVDVPGSQNTTTIQKLTPFTMYEVTVTAKNMHGSSLPTNAIRGLTLTPGTMKPATVAEAPQLPDIQGCCARKGVEHKRCVRRLCDPLEADTAEITDLMICAPWAADSFSCLTNGIDHTPCCKARGLPDLCQQLCAGNVTNIDFNFFKCLRYMSEFTNCLLQGYGVLPSSPTKVYVTNINVDFAILHWSPPKTLGDTVHAYNIHYRQLTTYDNDYKLILNVQSPYILDGLQSDTDYEFYVEALNSHGVSEPSVRLTFRTQSKIIEEEIEEAASYNVTACCVEAQVFEGCLPLCSYDANMTDIRALAGLCGKDFNKLLKCAAGGRNHDSCCSRRGVPASCLSLCSGFMGDSLYVTATICSPFIGNIVQCFEEGTDLIPGPVTDVSADVVNDTAIFIEWEPPNDGTNSTGYIIHYEKVDNSSSNQETLIKPDQETNETSAIIGNLEKGAVYHFYVMSKNKHGTSLPSSVIIIKLETSGVTVNGVPSPPHSLSVSAHSANYVTITWQPPQFSHPVEKITYSLYHKATQDESFQIINTTVTSQDIKGLKPNTQYIVYVTATSTKGQSAPSETLVAWTDPAYPAFVEPPTVHPINLIIEGSSMTILCIAMGTPMPTISLYISGRLVRQQVTRHMVTVIHNVTRDMDHISCYADNGYGTPMQATRKITISHIPQIKANGITMATLSDSVTLECKVEAHPEPKMIFWRNLEERKPVIESGKYHIATSRVKDEENLYLMQLTIKDISDVDVGDYFCHAENVFGQATQPVSVRIRNVAATNNVTQCCIEQNVTSPCMDACSFYLDIDAVIDKPECVMEFDKLMKCAADGSDHRLCCAQMGVPRRCLDWCQGEPLMSNQLCVLSYTKLIMGCFHQGRERLPGPPQNVHIQHIDAHNVRFIWDPPVKNPHTVLNYQVFWKVAGAPLKSALKNETTQLEQKIGNLKDGVTYEFLVRAANKEGLSTLTEPIRFTMGEKFITSAASQGEESSHAGVAIAVVLALVGVASIIIGAVWFIRTRKMLGLKGTGGIAFENPSYLREMNVEHVQVSQGQTEATLSNGIANGVAASSTSGGPGWRQEPLHVPASTEVNPTLYEELKLGQDGAGFKRLKP